MTTPSPKIIESECPRCKGPIRLVVGRKETARSTCCMRCGAPWDYSAWVIKKTDKATFTKIEMFPGEL